MRLVFSTAENHHTIYFWPALVAGFFSLLACVFFVLFWTRIIPSRIYQGQPVRVGDKAATAGVVWSGFSFTSLGWAALSDEVSYRWGVGLVKFEPFLLWVAGFTALIAVVVYLFAWPSVLIPPQLRGDSGHLALWVQRRKARRARDDE